jgi:hypothetical protein
VLHPPVASPFDAVALVSAPSSSLQISFCTRSDAPPSLLSSCTPSGAASSVASEVDGAGKNLRENGVWHTVAEALSTHVSIVLTRVSVPAEDGSHQSSFFTHVHK